jgi:hypothetical protein
MSEKENLAKLNSVVEECSLIEEDGIKVEAASDDAEYKDFAVEVLMRGLGAFFKTIGNGILEYFDK